MKPPVSMLLPALAGALLGATPALAHTPGGESLSFLTGLAHPVFGPDHVLAMLAVGLWAQRIGGRAVLVVPVAFALSMIAGFGLGLSHVTLPFVEPMILASVVVLGLVVALAVRPDVWICVVLVGLFALFHGNAHATELGSADAGGFGLGFVCATALLHAAGIGIGMSLGRIEARLGVQTNWPSRSVGLGTASLGLILALA